MESIYYHEEPKPRRLEGTWLQIKHKSELYRPHLCRVRLRRFTPSMIKSLDVHRHEHTHSIYHCIYFLDGNNNIMVDGESIPVRCGQMVLIDPDVSHNVIPQHQQACSFLTLMFTYQSGNEALRLPFSALIKKLAGSPTNPGIVVDDRSGILRSYFACMQNKFLESKDRARAHVSYCLTGILNELSAVSLNNMGDDAIPDDILLVRQYLLDNFDRDVTVKHLTQIAHLSRSHLLDKFKKHCGVSPIAFLINERIAKAKTYLIYSTHRIKEIALLCGFRSEYYFNKTFKKHSGITPGQFRKEKGAVAD